MPPMRCAPRPFSFLDDPAGTAVDFGNNHHMRDLVQAAKARATEPSHVARLLNEVPA